MKEIKALAVIYRDVETLVIPCVTEETISGIQKLLEDNLDNSQDCFRLEVKSLGVVEDIEDVEMFKDNLLEDLKEIQKDIDREFISMN